MIWWFVDLSHVAMLWCWFLFIFWWVVILQKKKHRQLKTVLCGRCHLLSHGHMITAVGGNGGYSGGKQFVSAEELREKLSHLRHEKALVVKLVRDTLLAYSYHFFECDNLPQTCHWFLDAKMRLWKCDLVPVSQDSKCFRACSDNICLPHIYYIDSLFVILNC